MATCLKWKEEKIKSCSEEKDNGYNRCDEEKDKGYSKCGSWGKFSWLCKAWVWISNVVCVLWTWVSNVVCIAWAWIRTSVCVLWDFLVTVVTSIWNSFVYLLRRFDCQISANPIEKKGWKLVFNDEFDGTSLDTTKWNTSAPWMAYQTSISPVQWGLYPFFTPNPRNYFDISCLTVNNSILTITSEFDPKSYSYQDPGTLGNSNWNIDYKSGYIETVPAFKQQYGFFEIRCKIPGTSGAWPAFWLMGDSPDPWPPEIDVFEFATSESTKSVQMTNIHWGTKDDPKQKAKKHQICDAGENFNIYGFEWTPGFMKWYFNNKLIRTETYHMNEFMYSFKTIVNGAMEDFTTNPSVIQGLPHKFEIDYVRIYK